ncbi:MAG: transglycosylase domain-containing protein, partial [Lachnospiraceae bacterium]|nr:transglycosylase domain-containing protein [Lachnospiraceae bacterium]
IGVRLFKGFLIFVLLIGIVGAVSVGLFLKHVVESAPEITAESIKPDGYSSTIYADDGVTPTGKPTASGANRIYKTIDQIPLHMQYAFVAVEDPRFYDHKGFDLKGILRAGLIGLTSGHFSQGGSTITQQLIKNNVFPDFVNETETERWTRKIQEIYLSIQLEKMLNKDAILESYMNTINLGQNTLGVQAASLRYFGKDVSELTLSECATIAGITQSPGTYNPITNPEANAKRRKRVLHDMLEQGYIDQAAHDEALADDVYARIQTVNTQILEEDNITSYFNDALLEQLMADLTSQDGLGYSDTQAYNAIYGSGLSIFSTQNLTIQQICEDELSNDANFPSNIEWGVDYALTIYRADGSQENFSSGHLKKFGAEQYQDSQGRLFASQEAAYARIEAFRASVSKEDDLSYDEFVNLSPQPQCSVSVIDQSTGHIKALVGGRGKKTTNRGLNRAYTGSKRQPGSCFKILAVYAPALETGSRTLASVEVDEPYKYSTGGSISNWWGNYYLGNVTVRDAIAESMNIPAVKVLQDISVNTGFEWVTEKFGISTLTNEDYVESLALGGITDGVYNYELTAAYAAIANGGVYNEPILYTKVLDHDGNILIDNTKEPVTIMKDTTAALLTSAMQDVVKSGTAAPYAQLKTMPAAGKSGTTTGNKDFWFAGYTPYYTCSIWLGYDDNKEMNGNHWYYHERIWSHIMDRINNALGLAYKKFEMPSSIVKRTICAETGLLALTTDEDTEDLIGICEETITEYFAPDSVPKKTCEGHEIEPPPEPEEPEEP